LRGDLHTHSHCSADGKNTLAEMVAAAKARGYAYYAITDHSHYLREGRMEEQAKEIDRLARKVAPQELLKGVEVNIKADGTLDVRDVDARLAGEAGVKIVISSDAHQVGALEYVDFGVAQARRAWLGPEQIANTRSWAQMKKLMKKS